MLTKDTVLKTVSEFPENFSLDELIDKLIFIEKVQNGLNDSLKENVNSVSESKKRLNKWLS